MEKIKLKDVHITKNDTCLTYVLKRLGLPTDFCTYITLHDKFSYYPFTAFEKKLQVGDVLIWENIPVKFHSAIFEGDDTFTDCTRLIHTPHPSLRMRMLSDIQKKPDWVLRLNN